jgi:hypothetical protein
MINHVLNCQFFLHHYFKQEKLDGKFEKSLVSIWYNYFLIISGAYALDFGEMVRDLGKTPTLIDSTQALALGTQYMLSGQSTGLKLLAGISLQNSELLREISVLKRDLEETKKVCLPHFKFCTVSNTFSLNFK